MLIHELLRQAPQIIGASWSKGADVRVPSRSVCHEAPALPVTRPNPCQLPDQSTILRVDSSSTSVRAFGAHCQQQTYPSQHNNNVVTQRQIGLLLKPDWLIRRPMVCSLQL